METLFGLGAMFWAIIFCFAVGSFLALPLIWYHIGHISRKLSEMTELQKENNTKLANIADILSGRNR